ALFRSERFAERHREGDIAQRPELPRPRASARAGEQILQSAIASPVAAESDAESVHLDRSGHHSSFRTGRSSVRNTQMPRARIARLIAAPTPMTWGSHWSGKNAMRYIEKMPASGLNMPRVSNGPGRSLTL